jgi:hypothetical protein
MRRAFFSSGLLALMATSAWAAGEAAPDVPRPPPRPVAEPAPPGPVYGPPLPLPPITAMPPPTSAANPCLDALQSAGATFEPAEPPKGNDPACVVENPVRLARVDVLRSGAREPVALAGKPLLACETALAVTRWVQTGIAPLARGHFDAPLSELGVGGGFECRQRNHQAGAPRSEHAYGRALDVLSFRIGNRTIRVETSPPADAGAFLHAVWASGCGLFSTALGPAADAFHATHIHVDLQPRRSPSSKFCE